MRGPASGGGGRARETERALRQAARAAAARHRRGWVGSCFASVVVGSRRLWGGACLCGACLVGVKRSVSPFLPCTAKRPVSAMARRVSKPGSGSLVTSRPPPPPPPPRARSRSSYAIRLKKTGFASAFDRDIGACTPGASRLRRGRQGLRSVHHECSEPAKVEKRAAASARTASRQASSARAAMPCCSRTKLPIRGQYSPPRSLPIVFFSKIPIVTNY